ncbi:hypothetical protein ADL15_22740 [Actinoplanes awajinensis subsp. mycoplanecinus]|uniref:Uncharacterized protein n=1 Tax=Actinoplanes awajinensis subsp. mycoplanecinus TaxID=135947 RepID=A0A117MR58_9ACTN|nr:hypothetical protein ADL15_22740 [Actinoplanes awajinensis subsp. mycoplanecinus]
MVVSAALVSVTKPRLPTAVLPLQVIAATGVTKIGLTPLALAAVAITPSSSLKRAVPTCRGQAVSRSLMPNWTIR